MWKPRGSRLCLVILTVITVFLCHTNAWQDLIGVNNASYCTVDISCAECRVGYFGTACQFHCYCIGSTQCDRATGHCPTGCHRNYWGTGCLLGNEPLIAGWFDSMVVLLSFVSFFARQHICYNTYMLSPVRPSDGCIIEKRLKLGSWNFSPYNSSIPLVFAG